jgi:SSS family solute:Na+ symporter
MKFIVLLFALQVIYWWVGRRSSRPETSQEDYFLAGKSVKLFPLAMTFLATQVGGGLVLGSAEEAYRYGWVVFLYPFGQAFGLIVLGLGVGRRLASFGVSTIAEIFEKVYGSAALKKIASLLSIVSLFMILVAQIIASHKFLVSMGLDNTPLFIVFWGIVISYTAYGGLRAVISTDVAQAVVFTVVFVLCFGWLMGAGVSLPPVHSEGFEAANSKLCGWLLMPLLFMVIEQDMGQRCFAGATPKIVSRAALLSGIVAMVVCFVPVFLGCVANALQLPVVAGGSVLMTTIESLTNPWITALVGCAVLAAIISTATSLINAIGSNLACDFSSRLNGKWICYGISFSAIGFAFYFNNVVDLLIQTYELSVGCMVVPIVAALFKRKGNGLSASLSMAFGLAGFILFRAFPTEFPKEIASICLSAIGYGIGEMISKVRHLTFIRS